MKTSDLFVKALEREGVEYIFGIPGEENLDLLESLAGSPIKLVLTRHEQAAGFMAATYGRLTGRAGVCLATLGPGATNLVTAAGYAQLGGMPMVMVTGQKPVKASKQGQFQILDVVDMMGPLTKYTQQLVSGARVPAQVREAFRLAQEERPGATHLELPEDVAREETNAAVIPASYVRRPICEAKAIRAAHERLLDARSPLLLIGSGANRKLCAKMLQRFVDRTGIPFVTTQMGKGVLDERSEHFLGNATLSSGDFVHRAIDAADVILNVGHDVVEKPPFLMKVDGVCVVHINFCSAAVDPVYFPQVELVGDIANSIWQLTEQFEATPKWDFTRLRAIRAALRAQQSEGQDDPSFPIRPQRIVADLRRATPEDGILALDNGIYKIWFARDYPAAQPNTVLLDNALATMGAGLPSAMAARLVHPHRKITAICGDGGFMMNSAELETAVRMKMQLVVLILRDDAYGMIRWKQAHMGFEDQGLTFGNPDFVRYAEAYGAKGYRVGAADELVPLLERCHAEDGVHVIDVPVDYTTSDHILNHEIQRRSAEV